MGRKMLEIPFENNGFQRSWGLAHSADSQKWRGKKASNSFGKCKIPEVLGAGGNRELAEIELRVDLSMARKKPQIPLKKR